MRRLVSVLAVVMLDLKVNRARVSVVMGTMAIAVSVMVVANLLLDSVAGLLQGDRFGPRMRQVRITPTTNAWIDGVALSTFDTVRFSVQHVGDLRERLGDAAEHVGWMDSSASRVMLGDTIRGVITFTVWGDPALAEFQGSVPAAFSDFGGEGKRDRSGAIPVLVSGALDRLVRTRNGGKTSIGQTLRASDVPWTIVGVASDQPGEWRLIAWLPATDHDLQHRAGSIVALASASRHPDALEQLAVSSERWLAETTLQGESGAVVWTRGLAMQEAVNRRARLLRGVLTTFALLCIVLAAAGVTAVQLAGLPARYREIGVRRAVGALRRDISREVVYESLLIGLGGSVLGVIAGIVLSVVIIRFLTAQSGQELGLELRVSSFVIPTLVGATAAVVSALWPARRASRVDPVKALRFE